MRETWQDENEEEGSHKRAFLLAFHGSTPPHQHLRKATIECDHLEAIVLKTVSIWAKRIFLF